MTIANRIYAIVMTITAIFFLIYSADLSKEASQWPRLFSFVLIFLSLCLMVETFFKKAEEKKQKKKYKQYFVEYKNVIIVTLLTIVYLLFMQYVGFLILTPIFLGVLLWILKYRSWPKIILISLGTTVGIILLFEFLLNVPLPEGFLRDYLIKIKSFLPF